MNRFRGSKQQKFSWSCKINPKLRASFQRKATQREGWNASWTAGKKEAGWDTIKRLNQCETLRRTRLRKREKPPPTSRPHDRRFFCFSKLELLRPWPRKNLSPFFLVLAGRSIHQEMGSQQVLLNRVCCTLWSVKHLRLFCRWGGATEVAETSYWPLAMGWKGPIGAKLRLSSCWGAAWRSGDWLVEIERVVTAKPPNWLGLYWKISHVGGCRCCNNCLLPITLHCTSHPPHFHLLWKRRLLSAHDATHSHYGGSAIDLQFCCPFDKGKKRKLPLALFYLCSSHCAIFMSSLKVSKVSSAKHFVP